MKQFSFKAFVIISFLGIVLFSSVPAFSYGAEKDAGCWGENTGFWKSIGCTVGKGIDAVSGIFGNKKETPASTILTPVQNEETLINENVGNIIADVEFKTREFQSVKKEYQEAKTVEKRTETLIALVAVSESRKESMKALMEKDPQKFLLNVITQKDRAQFPPEAQKNIENEVSFTGNIQTVYYDDFVNKKSYEEYFINSGSEQLKFFPVGLEGTIPSQTKIQANGFRLDNQVVVAVNSKNFSVLSMASSDIFGPQKVLVLLVNFLDSGTPPFTPEEAKKLIFEGQAQNFFKDQSYRKAYFEGDVFGWYTYQRSRNTNKLWVSDPEFIDMIQKYNIDLKQYGYVLLVGHGPNEGGGFSSVGKLEYFVNGIPYKTAFTFIGGSYDTGGYLAPSAWGQQPFSWTNLDYLLGHELGHALGVVHANSLECSDGFIINGPRCEHREYGNFYDVMGVYSYSLSFNALFKEVLGWLDDSSIQTISTSGRYELRPIENSDGIRGAKVKIRGSDDTAFYIEYRRGVGFDARLNESRFAPNQSGVFINKYIKPAGSFVSPRLLDMTPVPMGSWDDVTLKKETGIFYDPVSGITIGPIISATQEKIVFDVIVDEPQCGQAYPMVTGLYSKNIVSGQSFYLDFNLTNEELERCPIQSFTNNLSLPEGCNVERIEYYTSNGAVSGSVISLRGKEQKNVIVKSICSPDISEGVYSSTFFMKNTQNVEKVAKKETSLLVIKPLSVKVSSDSPISKKIEKGTKKFSLLKFDVENNSKYTHSLYAFNIGVSGGGVSLDVLKDGQVLVEGVRYPKGAINSSVNIPDVFIEGGSIARFEIRASIDLDNEEEKIRAEINNIFAYIYHNVFGLPIYGNWMYFNNNDVPKISITQPSSEITLNRGKRFKLSWNAESFLSSNNTLFLYIVSGTEGKENEVIQSYGDVLAEFMGDFFIETSWFPPDGTYRIRMREPNSGAEAFSKKITIKTPSLATPMYFSAWYPYVNDVGIMRDKVNLAWFDVSSAEDGFEIWRSIDDGGFAPFPEIGQNITFAVDSFSSSTTQTTLRYKIRAFQTKTKCSPWIMPLEYLKLRPKRVLPCKEIKIYSDFSPFVSPDSGIGSIVSGYTNPIVGSDVKIPLKDLVEIRIQNKDNSFFVKGLTKDEIIFSAPPKIQKTKLDALFDRNEKIYQDAWSVTE